MSGRLPSQERLRELLDYDPDSGLLTWRARPGDDRFNTRFAGMPALNCKSGKHGYRHGQIIGKWALAHRVIWKWITGDEPPQIDHLNGKRWDNRQDNLRAADNKINSRNRARYSSNTSGHCGVHFHRRDGRWHANINHGGRKRFIGGFATKGEAIAARKARQAELGYSERHGT